jgi:hypothetical protein
MLKLNGAFQFKMLMQHELVGILHAVLTVKYRSIFVPYPTDNDREVCPVIQY